MNRYYLAVDIGASSGRHILGRMENGKMKLREIYRFSNGMEMVDGTLCWNLNGLFEEIKAGMRECKKLGINPESMGIDTWAVDFVLLDKQGHVLGKTAGYRDRRTEGMDLKVYERISREELFRRTGIQKQIFNTVYQLMAVKEKQPDILSNGRYLHFQIADVLPVQNLVENLVWSLMHEREGMQAMNQTTMGLLLRHLMHYTGRIRVNRDSEQSFEQQLTLQVLRYIDEHYREGSLTELAALMGYDVYWLSRAINRLLGRNYKELLQIKRLNQAAFLLHNTRMPVADVSFAVGYDNTSYFYRIFRTYYGMSPREYRKTG